MTAPIVSQLEYDLVHLSEEDYLGTTGDALREQLATVRPHRSASAIAADYSGEVRDAKVGER